MADPCGADSQFTISFFLFLFLMCVIRKVFVVLVYPVFIIIGIGNTAL